MGVAIALGPYVRVFFRGSSVTLQRRETRSARCEPPFVFSWFFDE